MKAVPALSISAWRLLKSVTYIHVPLCYLMSNTLRNIIMSCNR